MFEATGVSVPAKTREMISTRLSFEMRLRSRDIGSDVKEVTFFVGESTGASLIV